MTTRACLCALAMASAFWGATAACQERPTATLTISQSEECVDPSTLRDAVAARLGYVPFVDGAERVVSVTIRASARAVVRLEGTGLVRAIASSTGDCRGLTEAVALAVAVMIDPDSLVRPLRELPRATPEPTPEVDATHAELPAPRPAEPVSEGPVSTASRGSSETLRFSLALFAVGATGATPGDFSAGGELVFRVRVGDASVALAARGLAPTELATADGGRIRGTPLGGALLGCGHLGVLAGCGRVSVAAFWAEGRGWDGTRSALTPIVETGIRASITLPERAAWAFEAWIDVDAAWLGTSLEWRGAPQWQSSVLRASLGIGARVEWL